LLTKIKSRKYFITAGIILLIIVFLYLVNTIYGSTLEDAKHDHQLQQLEMAKSVAQGINFFIEHLVRDMELLTHSPDVLSNPSKNDYAAFRFFKENYDSTIIRSIFLADSSGSVIFSTGRRLPVWSSDKIPVLTSLIDSTDSAYVFSDVMPDISNNKNSPESFLIIIRIPGRNKSSSNYFIGYLVDFDILIKHFIKPLKLTSDDFAWVLDGEGRLIYHPRHQEMLFRSIFKTNNECSNCHVNFNTQSRMIKANHPAVDEYYVLGNEPHKIMAYVPLKLQNQTWIIAISTLLPKVTTGLRSRFQLFFILGLIILAVMLTLGFIIYFINLRRIRAEEVNRNLEEISQYREQLNQASKLASIGELVDSVAHEINTPAGIIAAHADALLLEDKKDKSIREQLNIIRNQTRRIGDYTRTLLTYSRSMPFRPEALRIQELIDECVYLVGHRLKANKIRLTKSYDTSLPLLLADKRQMEQVLINILNNAVDALPEGGEIKIKTGKNDIEDNSSGSKKINGMFISVEDNGIGIKKENLSRIFNPFFSTKLDAQGTGLGLSISRTIVQRYHGILNVESEEGKFTRFTITLPYSSEGIKI
jgi:signal transduction histidine kinase